MKRTASLDRTYYGDNAENPENHNIHLEGEFDFNRTKTMEEIYQTLHERAMQIGGLVTLHEAGQKIKVKHANAMSFTLYGDGMESKLKKIKSTDQAENQSVTHTMEELEESAKKTEKLLKEIEEKGEWKVDA